MKVITYCFFLFFILSVGMYKTIAQNTVSPYSAYGIGDLQWNTTNRWSGLGFSSIAFTSNRNINDINAAALADLDPQFFAMEVSAKYNYTGYNYTNSTANIVTTNSDDISFKKVAIAHKITNRWGVALGFKPFSTYNYQYNTDLNVIGSTTTVPTTITGFGGVNQVFLNNGYKLNKNLSLGIKLSYLFGSLNHTELTTSFFNTNKQLRTTEDKNIGSAYLNYDILFQKQLNKRWDVKIGASYATTTALNESDVFTQLFYYPGSGLYDTLSRTGSVKTFNLPQTFTVGGAITLNNAWTLTGEYTYQNWNQENIQAQGYRLVNSHKIAGGLQYVFNYTNGTIRFERSYFQIGSYYNASYLQLYGRQITQYGVTIGGGVNSLKSPLGFSFAVDIGTRGLTSRGLIQENYTNIIFTLSYRDLWFTKGRRYD